MATKGLSGLSMSTCSSAASSAVRASLRYTSAGRSCDFSQRTTAASVGVVFWRDAILLPTETERSVEVLTQKGKG